MNLDAPPGFTGNQVDRADHLREQDDRVAELASSLKARLMRMRGLEPDVDGECRLVWGSTAEAADGEPLIFLGMRDDTPLFAPVQRVDVIPGRPGSLFQLIGAMDREEVALFGAARSLIAWHNRHGFCSNCGAPTIVFRAGWGRRCPACASDHFPRVDPIVIMLAEHDGRILLGRQRQFAPGFYSALAGFLEPGESIEEAVARELAEEAGITVTNVRYAASQPWPFPSGLMIGCVAEARSDALILDANELEDAIWVDRAGVMAAVTGDSSAPFSAPPPYTIANTLMRRWLKSA
jgi:NAD+ diphosphatase